MIHHSITTLSPGGGMQTYIRSLLNYRSLNISDRIIYSLKEENQSQFELLHIHDQQQLQAVRGECPVVFTLHNHSTYCPSGSKYLRLSQTCCDRKMSLLGCTWGSLVDGCGSRRPQRILQGLRNSYDELSLIQRLKIPVIAISHYAQQQLLRHGLPAEQVILLRHGIEVPQTTSCSLTLETHQAQRMLFVGRIVPDKGLQWLINTMAQLDPAIQLDVAGEGWAQPQMKRLAEQRGVSDRITWHNWCDAEKLNYLYQQCFTVLFPSLWPEPAGLVTLEAYARYRPVIASQVGGIPEYIRHQETGLLVEANNCQQLAAAIMELATNYSRCKRMGERGHQLFLNEFTMEQHIQSLQKIYETVIEHFSAQKTLKIS